MRKILLYMMTVTMLTMGVGAKAPLVSYAQAGNVTAADSEDGKYTDEEEAADSAEELSEADDEEDEETREREELVIYALQFVGGSYREGGNDPHTGVDCSGFIRYVMANGAGISMYRSSREQATQGVSISADQMQPGDLLFYSNGSRINHVAMYIGDGRVVHASTEKTGIKTSVWNYRNPVRIVSMFG
ncbi:MAG: C40 family peptidase [Clostridiales bacterium]|nr:C40 family peptidase [Clostridiales bacterium]